MEDSAETSAPEVLIGRNQVALASARHLAANKKRQKLAHLPSARPKRGGQGIHTCAH